jgi:SNF2 family DNA or RNA helicase
LGSIVSPVVIRRRVSEVAKDLPERLDRWIAFELEPGIRSEYETIESARSAFEANTALRVLCAHADPALDDQRRFEATSKCSRLVELLEEIFELGENVLVFASFTATIARIHQMLVARFPGGFFEMVTGETAGVERQRIIDRFESSKNPGGLILNPRAAGIGLNITAANHVIHFNPEYNPAVTAQATARAFRRGQTRTVFIHHFYYVNSVEERTVDIASAKTAVAEGLDQGIALSEWWNEAEFL